MHTLHPHWKLPILSLAVTLFFSLTSTAEAAQFPVTLTCEAKTPLTKQDESTSFSLTSGLPIHFTCTLNNSENREFSGFLMGKVIGLQESPIISSQTLTLKSGGGTQAILDFPATSRLGTYQFQFSLLDTLTKQPLARDFLIAGTLKGKELARITTVTLDKEQYEWSNPFQLKFSLYRPAGSTFESEPLFLDVYLIDKKNQPCQSFIKKLPMLSVDHTLDLLFPEQGKCANGLVLSLKDEDGAIVNEKTLAVVFNEKAPASVVPPSDTEEPSSARLVRTPRAIFVGLSLTGVILISLIGYFFILRRK